MSSNIPGQFYKILNCLNIHDNLYAHTVVGNECPYSERWLCAEETNDTINVWSGFFLSQHDWKKELSECHDVLKGRPHSHCMPTRTERMKVKLSLWLTKHHAMKTCWWSGGIAPRILDLNTRWRWTVSFTPRPIYTQKKNPRYPLDRRLGGPKSRSGHGVEEKNSEPPPGFEPQSSDRPARSQSVWLSYPGSYAYLYKFCKTFFRYISTLK